MAPKPTAISKPAGRNRWWLLALPILLAVIKQYMNGPLSPYTNVDMKGQIVIVTGANTGIGLHTAEELARLHATVIMVGRDEKRINAALAQVKKANPSADVSAELCDLASLASVNAFAKKMKAQLKRLDRLILNAGVMIPPYMTTADGFELQWGTNHVAHQALTEALLPLVLATAGSRVIAVSSGAHGRGNVSATIADPAWVARPYNRFQAYADSKHANVLMAYHLQKLMRATGRDATAFSLHPGAIDTELGRHVPYYEYLRAILSPVVWLLMKDSWHGAQTQLYLATAPASELAPHAGRYYADCAPLDGTTLVGKIKQATGMVHKQQFDAKLAEAQWEATHAAISATGKMTEG